MQFPSAPPSSEDQRSQPPAFKVEAPNSEEDKGVQEEEDEGEEEEAEYSSSSPGYSVAASSPKRRGRSKRTRRAPLSFEQVYAIFARRPERDAQGTYLPCAKLTREVCLEFDVKERCVRDIWNRRTWADVTRPFCTVAELAAELQINAAAENRPPPVIPVVQMRKRGRPKGSKDSIPRRQSGGNHEALQNSTDASQNPGPQDAHPEDNTKFLLHVMEPPGFEFDGSSPRSSPFGYSAAVTDTSAWWSSG